jgi:hypothetical protein
MRVGDTGSKELFRAHKQHTGASRITALEDPVGVIHSMQAKLENICKDYYSKLYRRPPGSSAQSGACEQALACVSDRLFPEMKARLKAPVGKLELDEALKGMASGKSSGPDGVVIEFYKVFWDLIGEDYHKMILEAVSAGSLPRGVTNGLISLLYKEGGRGQLTNWRPITLLNVGYELFAKALQLRLQSILMKVISFDQAAFLPMRFILDNVLLTHEILEWTEYSKQPLIFLKLDFSKAYDMVDLTFLYEVMQKFGFPKEFVEMSKLLFKDAAACVKVNGALTTSFDI